MSEPTPVEDVTRRVRVVKIVLTGGPCSGKTTCLTILRDRFSDMGWKVYVVPEAATLLFGGGLSFPEMTEAQRKYFQTHLLRLMVQMEDSFHEIAKLGDQKTLIICDRGALDGKAYIDAPMWQSMLEENGWNEHALRDHRYDGVVHLVTAAEGAEQYYTLANNAVRLETPEEARVLDSKLKESWLGHPYFAMIDNSTDFPTKVKRVIQAVCNFVGESEPGLLKRKFLVRHTGEELPVKYLESHIQYDYLCSYDGAQVRIRKRDQGDTTSYSVTLRYAGQNDSAVQVRRSLSAREYLVMLSQCDRSRVPIHKHRRNFMYLNHAYHLDFFVKPRDDLVILESYMSPDFDLSKLPPFIEVQREVTGIPEFSMFNIAFSGSRNEGGSAGSSAEV
eukprot:TRINITY_DN4809_c0_g3_i1.p1 TRINITY_DN4809_c0_g3~~TRINITY_DN4809_c0_g3_i1.p1  ORF type:complete len:390 (+),score=99.00 TRINITY_DN4809_c0_g3_i1:88-1257(+)